MLKVYRIPIPKDRLRAMPKDERVLFVLLGYASNQISMLQKLLTFATNRTPDTELEQHATGAQTQMLVRLTVGALNEAWEMVRTRFIETPMAQSYLPVLDADGQKAFAALKRQFGDSNLLNQVRTHFAFHYPKSDDVDEAVETVCDDPELGQFLNLYFSHHGFNSLFFVSDIIFIEGITKKSKEPNAEAAQKKLMQKVGAASRDVVDFARAFAAAAWLKHFGEEMLARDQVEIGDAPHVDDVVLPFFVEVQRRA